MPPSEVEIFYTLLSERTCQSSVSNVMNTEKKWKIKFFNDKASKKIYWESIKWKIQALYYLSPRIQIPWFFCSLIWTTTSFRFCLPLDSLTIWSETIGKTNPTSTARGKIDLYITWNYLYEMSDLTLRQLKHQKQGHGEFECNQPYQV